MMQEIKRKLQVLQKKIHKIAFLECHVQVFLRQCSLYSIFINILKKKVFQQYDASIFTEMFLVSFLFFSHSCGLAIVYLNIL